jgi:hypothetical protein
VTPRLRPDVQFRAGRGVGNEPHLGFRLAAQFGRLIRGRMNLERKFFRASRILHSKRKTIPRGRFCAAEQFACVMFHEPAQIFSGERTVGDDAGVAGPVTDFPRFADERAGGSFLP